MIKIIKATKEHAKEISRMVLSDLENPEEISSLNETSGIFSLAFNISMPSILLSESKSTFKDSFKEIVFLFLS